MNGFLLVNKPKGISTYDLIREFKKVNPEFRKQIKIGHAGTLDPFATGLVILLLGKATKQFSQFQNHPKTYLATAKLGFTSASLDTETPKTKLKDSTKPNQTEIKTVIKNFPQQYDQKVPVYSAVKIKGQPAYKLARAGKLAATNKTKEVNIKELKFISYNYPELAFEAKVSSGTYIRQLAADLAEKLGTKCILTGLKRTQIGPYSLDSAINIASLKNCQEHLITPD